MSTKEFLLENSTLIKYQGSDNDIVIPEGAYAEKYVVKLSSTSS